jgi:hypothetical protein
MKLCFSIRDLLWLTLLVGIAGCDQSLAPVPAPKTPAQLAQEADEEVRRKVAENMKQIGKALQEYEKTHPPQYDENGVPLKSPNPTANK